MKVLLPIDQSPATEKIVQFAAKLIAGSNEISVTLVHVVESLPDFVVKRSDGLQQLTDEWEKSACEAGESLLETVRASLMDSGVDPAQINTKLILKDALPEAKRVVAALAIIDEMKNGDYQIICVGRRGTALSEGYFIGSVAEKILREAAGRTVCVVD